MHTGVGRFSRSLSSASQTRGDSESGLTGTQPSEEQNESFWALACVLFGTIAVLKGLRKPGSWAKSQLQITYLHGFVKRGFLGQVLRIAHIRSSRAVDVFCFAELVLLIGLLALFTMRSGLLSEKGNAVLSSAFAGSYAVTFLAHLIGYQDIPLYAFAVALVSVRRLSLRFLLAFPICVVALLIHENFLLSALPVILFSFIADGKGTRLRQTTTYVGSLLLVCLGVTVLIALRPSLSQFDLQQLKRDTVATETYTVDTRVLDLLGMSTKDNLRLNFAVVSHNWWWWIELAVAILVNGPLVALILVSASKLVQGKRKAAFLASSMAPLLLNFIGWDNVRWVALCVVSSYINLGLLVRASDREVEACSPWQYRHASILVLGLGLASGHGLMDTQKINPYPFFPPALRPSVIRHDGIVGAIL